MIVLYVSTIVIMSFFLYQIIIDITELSSEQYI